MKSMRKYKGHLATTCQSNSIRVYPYTMGSRSQKANVLGDNEVLLFIQGTRQSQFVMLTRFGIRYVSSNDFAFLRWITC